MAQQEKREPIPHTMAPATVTFRELLKLAKTSPWIVDVMILDLFGQVRGMQLDADATFGWVIIRFNDHRTMRLGINETGAYIEIGMVDQLLNARDLDPDSAIASHLVGKV